MAVILTDEQCEKSITEDDFEAVFAALEMEMEPNLTVGTVVRCVLKGLGITANKEKENGRKKL